MEVTEFGFRLLMLFLPGIIGVMIFDYWTRSGKPASETKFLIAAFVHGSISYVVYWSMLSVINWIFGTQYYVMFERLVSSDMKIIPLSEIGVVTIVAVFLSIFASYFVNYRLHVRLQMVSKISCTFGNKDVWKYMYENSGSQWVTLRYPERNLAFRGWVKLYSDNYTDGELLLSDVDVYKNDTGEDLYQVSSLYIRFLADKHLLEIGNITLPSDK